MSTESNSSLRQYVDLQVKRLDDLAAAETLRVDQIRVVDLAALDRVAEFNAAQLDALAAALSGSLDPIKADIADLRRFQYEAVGVRTNESEGRDNIAIWVAAISATLIVLVNIANLIIALR